MPTVTSNGSVESIYIASAAEGPPQSVDQAVAIPGSGLEGDRYALHVGTFYKSDPDYELTLIEAEAIEAVRRDYQIEILAGDARRNIVTRNVALNHLVGEEFCIGDVRIRGIRLCEPCDHLQRLTGKPLIKSLLHRGGLRAQVLTAGTIRVGDQVRAISDESLRAF
jgi:MOSC domain-containing protein YiiM